MTIRALLWVDCSAGAANGVVMLALAGVLAPLFGVPTELLVTTGLVNLAYGTYSFSLARRPTTPRGLVGGLIAANFTWAALCVVLAVTVAGRWLGAAFLVGEALVVGALATLEARALRREGRTA